MPPLLSKAQMRPTILTAVLLLVPGLARAAEPPAGARERWYGWQTALVDGASLTSGFAGLLIYLRPDHTGGSALMGLGIAGYTLGAPLVHVGHARPLTALADFGLRVGAPSALGLLGYAVSGPTDSERGYGAAVGVLVGLVSAMAIDARVLAREAVPPPTACLPAIVPRPGGVDVGVGGTW